MAVPAWPDRPAQDSMLEARAAATGELLGTYPIADRAAVAEAVARARTAAAWWADLGFSDRGRRLRALAGLIARRGDELARLIARENGKPVSEGFIEVILCVEHLIWAARNAPRVLGRRRVRSTLILANVGATLEYRPLGVVGVIGPWNYPLFTPMGSIGYALAAGNAVVFKPSELGSAVGAVIADLVAEVAPEQPLVQVVHGGGEVGNALVASGVDKIAFTGSSATGRKVLAAAAESLTPVLMECGGKDACIVAADADLDDAAAGAVWGGLSNAGQTCAGVERVYVVADVYEPLLERIVERASEVRVGDGPDAHVGPLTLPSQVEVVRRHVEDALQRGARAVVGGLESIKPPYVEPIVLVDVPEDSLVMRHETFGPVLPVVAVPDIDEAIRRANASAYALGAAVYSRAHGRAIAKRLNAGMISVNSVLQFAGIPGLPFGGSGESGFGRVHGADGLREMATPRAVAARRFPLPFETNSFRGPDWLWPAVGRWTAIRYGRR